MHTAEVVVQQEAILGEGALWHDAEQVLYWVDIPGQKVFRYDSQTEQSQTFKVGMDVGTVVTRSSGGLLLAVPNGFATLDLETRAAEVIKNVEADLPDNRFNDGKCDPAGRFWAGTMGYDCSAPASGALYVLERDWTVRQVLRDVGCSNGLTWSADHKMMYYIDSRTQQIHGFDFDVDTGEISNRRTVVSVDPNQGIPDGMAIDSNGNLWVALFAAGRIGCWNPTSGELLDTVNVPGALFTTSCAFGGPDLNELYITTGFWTLSTAERKLQPDSGALFKVTLDVRGAKTFEFGG